MMYLMTLVPLTAAGIVDSIITTAKTTAGITLLTSKPSTMTLTHCVSQIYKGKVKDNNINCYTNTAEENQQELEIDSNLTDRKLNLHKTKSNYKNCFKSDLKDKCNDVERFISNQSKTPEMKGSCMFWKETHDKEINNVKDLILIHMLCNPQLIAKIDESVPDAYCKIEDGWFGDGEIYCKKKRGSLKKKHCSESDMKNWCSEIAQLLDGKPSEGCTRTKMEILGISSRWYGIKCKFEKTALGKLIGNSDLSTMTLSHCTAFVFDGQVHEHYIKCYTNTAEENRKELELGGNWTKRPMDVHFRAVEFPSVSGSSKCKNTILKDKCDYFELMVNKAVKEQRENPYEEEKDGCIIWQEKKFPGGARHFWFHILCLPAQQV